MNDPFHVRFDINLPLDEAQIRFVKRIENELRKLVDRVEDRAKRNAYEFLNPLMIEVETRIGEAHDSFVHDTISFIAAWRRVIQDDFTRSLSAVEAVYDYVKNYPEYKQSLEKAVPSVLVLSETDLGISWQDGVFTRKGARVLDVSLVNEPLRWLAEPAYRNVLVPFEKGLKHLLEGEKDAQRLADAVTDMYEAVEALAKIVTEKPAKDLSALREEFISKLGLPGPYKKMLREFIDYGCDFRHALEQGKSRSWPSPSEAEAFVYLTGLFIRLSIEKIKS